MNENRRILGPMFSGSDGRDDKPRGYLAGSIGTGDEDEDEDEGAPASGRKSTKAESGDRRTELTGTCLETRRVWL